MKSLGVRKQTIAVGLLTIILGIVCLGLLIPWTGIALAPRAEQRYADAAASQPSSEATLSTLERFTDPTMIGTQELRSTGLSKALPTDPVAEYLGALSNFSINMQSLKTRTQNVQTAFAIGDFNQAPERIRQLRIIRSEAKSNLDSLYSTLSVLQNRHGWNSTKLQEVVQRLNGLHRQYDEYSVQLNQLESQVNLRTVSLSLVPSNATVFVNEPLHVQGQLASRNGTVLANRHVTIDWGSNEVSALTSYDGSFVATLLFPVTYPPGNTTIVAAFQPTGADAASYVATYTTIPIRVAYFPTRINAQLSSRLNYPLEKVSINGRLTTLDNNPLANRMIFLTIDRTRLGNVMTRSDGNFLFDFQVPSQLENGNHNLVVFFISNAERFASTNASIPFAVERERTLLHVKLPSTILVSGIPLSFGGVVDWTNSSQGSLLGNVTVSLDGVQYGTNSVASDGTFSSTLPVPISTTFGNHSIQVTYVPNDPRIDKSVMALQVYVFNVTIVAGLAALIGLVSVIALLGRRRLKARRASTPPERVRVEKLMMPREVERIVHVTQPDWGKMRATVEAETNPAKQVTVSFRLAQTLINNAMNERTRKSETHREFYSRVSGSKPALEKQLKPLVELFELAEYSPFMIQASQGEEAKQILFSLREAKWT